MTASGRLPFALRILTVALPSQLSPFLPLAWFSLRMPGRGVGWDHRIGNDNFGNW